MFATPHPMDTLLRVVQFTNALDPILVTLSGMEKKAPVWFNLVQPPNALPPMLVTPLPIDALVRLMQLKNAPLPMLVMPLPTMLALLRAVQPLNA